VRHLPLVTSTLDPPKTDAVAEETELKFTLEGDEPQDLGAVLGRDLS
jgi:hypothetical protein